MSLVGPRPTLAYQVEQYTPRQRRRLDVKPGLTGWAQVNGRAKLLWTDRIELDLWYVEHRSAVARPEDHRADAARPLQRDLPRRHRRLAAGLTAVLFTCAGQRVDIVTAFGRAGGETIAADVNPSRPRSTPPTATSSRRASTTRATSPRLPRPSPSTGSI